MGRAPSPASLLTERSPIVASTAATTTDFVNLVAEEIVAGIDYATECWLARVEQELSGPRVSCADRLHGHDP